MAIDPNKKFLYVNRDATTGEMDEALCFPVSSFIGAETQTSTKIELYFKGSKGADATVVRVFHVQHGLIKTFYKNLVDEINFGENAFINIYDHGRRNTFPSDVSFNMSKDIQPTFTLQDTDFIVAGDNLTFDSVQLTGIQTSGESFSNDDVSLMTSAAIQDQILADAPAVTLAGTPDYITISGQEITRNQIDLTADVTGTLPVANGGTGATSLTDNAFLMGSGTGAIEASPHLKYSEPSGNVDTFTFGDDSTTTVSIVSDNRANLNLSVEAASGTTDTDGGDLTLTAGGSTGAGDPGDIIFLVSPSTSTGPGTTNQNTPVEVMRLEQGSLTLQSSITSSPSFILKSTDSAVNTGHSIQFVRDEGDAGASGDILGIIQFTGDDAGQTQTDYAKFLVTTDVATDGQESGKIELQVASHDAELVTGLSLTGGSAEDEIDVTIGSGSDSIVTVPGFVSIGGHAINDIDVAGEFVDSDEHLMTAAAINDQFGGGGGIAFDGSTANGVLTFKDSDEATVEANMTYDGDDLTLTSSSASQPVLKMQSTHTHGGRAAELRFIKDADDTTNGEALGYITWFGDDDAGNNQQFIKIKGEIEESGSGNEGGKLTVYVASHNGTETQGLVVEDGDASGEVDVTLGNGGKSIVTCPGKLVAKTIQCFSSNFFDDIGTTKHYVPLSTQSTSEQTSDGNTLVDFLAPCDLSIREVMLKLPASTTGSGNITAGIETSNIGSTPVTKSSVETETVAVTSSNDNDIVHFRFDETTHATLGQNVCVTIQSDTDLSSSQNWYVNVIMELDWNTMHTGSSSVQTS